jgi:hypothetical protein
MLHHVAWYIAIDVSEERFASTFKVKQSKNLDS